MSRITWPVAAIKSFKLALCFEDTIPKLFSSNLVPYRILLSYQYCTFFKLCHHIAMFLVKRTVENKIRSQCSVLLVIYIYIYIYISFDHIMSVIPRRYVFWYRPKIYVLPSACLCTFFEESYCNGPLTRYVKLRVVHAPGMPGKFFPVAKFMTSIMHVLQRRTWLLPTTSDLPL